jgi:hypothetical protein
MNDKRRNRIAMLRARLADLKVEFVHVCKENGLHLEALCCEARTCTILDNAVIRLAEVIDQLSEEVRQ